MSEQSYEFNPYCECARCLSRRYPTMDILSLLPHLNRTVSDGGGGVKSSERVASKTASPLFSRKISGFEFFS